MLTKGRKNRLTFESTPTRHHINPTHQRQIRFMKEIGLVPAYINPSQGGGRPPVKVKLDPILINLANELILTEANPPPLTVITPGPRNPYEANEVSLTTVHPESRTRGFGTAVPSPVLHSRAYVRPDFILTANILQKDGSPSTDLSAVEEVIRTAKNYISRFGPIYGCCAIYEPLLEGNFDETLDENGKAIYDETYDYYRKDPYKFINIHTFKVIGWSGTNWVVKSEFGKAFGENGLFLLPFGNLAVPRDRSGVLNRVAETRRVTFEYLTRHVVDEVKLNGPGEPPRSLIGGFFIIPKQYVEKNESQPVQLLEKPPTALSHLRKVKKIKRRVSLGTNMVRRLTGGPGGENEFLFPKVFPMVIIAILLGVTFWMLKRRR